jgi:hypothetical protein
MAGPSTPQLPDNSTNYWHAPLVISLTRDLLDIMFNPSERSAQTVQTAELYNVDGCSTLSFSHTHLACTYQASLCPPKGVFCACRAYVQEQRKLAKRNCSCCETWDGFQSDDTNYQAMDTIHAESQYSEVQAQDMWSTSPAKKNSSIKRASNDRITKAE